jgi:3-oxoisoapionate decarboxylase
MPAMTSLVGLSTYAYFWRMSERIGEPMSLDDVLRDAAAHGAEVFQICDHEPLTTAGDARLQSIRTLANELRLELEIGTRGTDPAHLRRYLDIAKRLDAGLVRTMCTSGDDRPATSETVQRLESVTPLYEAAGVTLALETYEQVPTEDLVGIIQHIGSDSVGICLDPANTVANLEMPDDVVARCVPFTRNWHVKDFDFTRLPGWVGFRYGGVAIGTGRLDYAGIARALHIPHSAVNRIIEFWLPWQSSENTPLDEAAATVRTEAEWTSRTIDYIRSNTPSPTPCLPPPT